MYEFKEIPFDEEQQKKLDDLLETARKVRATQVFNNPMFIDVLNTPEFRDYIEETYILDKDRWN
tara:strand:+ start:1063 stop:1254 length:192 start_codon:yes stop_codon:yes gene_type:complete